MSRLYDWLFRRRLKITDVDHPDNDSTVTVIDAGKGVAWTVQRFHDQISLVAIENSGVVLFPPDVWPAIRDAVDRRIGK